MRESAAVERDLGVGELRRLILDHAQTLLRTMSEREELNRTNGFVKLEPTPLRRRYSSDELHGEVRALAAAIGRHYPQTAVIADQTMKLADQAVSVQTGAELLQIFTDIVDLHRQGGAWEARGNDVFTMRTDGDRVYISASDLGDDPEGALAKAVASDLADQMFVVAVTNMLSMRRRQRRRLTRYEAAAVQTAYRLLDRGVKIPAASQTLGISGFRRYQTLLSVSDPGDAHIRVTCPESDLLRGVVLHLEHVDRDKEFDREKVEPYRLPAAINAARVRLHAGAAAPCTAFIGRPVFESQSFSRDLLKTVHLIANASTAMFLAGIVDCKIGLEHMTANEALLFMKAIVGNVVRESHRQYLSAAININTPIVDDRDGKTVSISVPFDIACVGVEVALAGGFDRIAWDGASNKVPADPIVEQLSFARLLALIHLAHEAGLETYISAGMTPEHMRVAVNLGVGGVGMGTSLHHVDADTKLMGELKPGAIREALDTRDEAASQWQGRAARLLARLDRLYFERSLPAELDPSRIELFHALQAQNRPAVLRLTEELAVIERMADDTDHPVIERANRLIAWSHRDPIAAREMDPPTWQAFIRELGGLVDRREVTQLQEVLTVQVASPGPTS